MEKKIFEKTDGIRGKVGEEPVTRETMYGMGRAVGRFFDGGVILVGRDTRESGEWIRDEVARGLAEIGVEVWDVGVVSTPGLGRLVKTTDAVGGVMITASHNPATENGLKVFRGDGDKLTDKEELEVEAKFFADDREMVDGGEILERKDLVEGYEKQLVEVAGGVDLGGLKVGVDSAAGGAYELSRRVFEKLGVESFEVSAAPDGSNINVECGALYPEKMVAKVSEADMGVILDGDADRVMVADETGRIWNGDRIVALLAKELGYTRVVVTEYSNLGVVNYLKDIGVEVLKVVNGDRFVAEKCVETATDLGGEFSGHILKMDWLTSSDGMMVAVLLLKIMKQRGVKLSEMWPEYEDYPQRIWSLEVREKVPLEEVAGWSEAEKKWSKYLGNEGRLFARYSGTEKKLRIMVESVDEKKMEEAGEALVKIIKEEIGND